MGRAVKITKEMMLEAAYDILLESGYNAVNIKSIASKVGCSTQPVSWHFGNMKDMRKELFSYALERMNTIRLSFKPSGNAILDYFEIGKNNISLACEYPNLYKFIFIEGPGDFEGPFAKTNNLFDIVGDPGTAKILSEQYGLNYEKTLDTLRSIEIYTHGLASLMIWDNFRLSTEKAFEMIFNEGKNKLELLGINIENDWIEHCSK